MELDPDDFRAPVEMDLDALQKRPSKKPPKHRKGFKFLKGPIPWDWLEIAMRLPGRAMHVAVLLWTEAGMKRKATVKFNQSAASKIGIHPDTAKRGLRALQAAKLVGVKHHPGQALEVTLLDAPAAE